MASSYISIPTTTGLGLKLDQRCAWSREVHREGKVVAIGYNMRTKAPGLVCKGGEGQETGVQIVTSPRRLFQ